MSQKKQYFQIEHFHLNTDWKIVCKIINIADLFLFLQHMQELYILFVMISDYINYANPA